MTSKFSTPLFVKSNLINVLTWWFPYNPAAPGFRCNPPNSGQLFAISMWLWPQMKISGLLDLSFVSIPGANRGGRPPIWVIQILRPLMEKVWSKGNSDLTSAPSILPYTARSGAIFESSSVTRKSPISPACQISLQLLRCFITRSSM